MNECQVLIIWTFDAIKEQITTNNSLRNYNGLDRVRLQYECKLQFLIAILTNFHVI